MYSIIRYSKRPEDWQMTKNGRNIPHGQLQYKVLQKDILSLQTNIENSVYNNRYWIFEQHSKENLQKLIPNTKTGKANEWKILLILKQQPNTKPGTECLKGALLNNDTNEIALMTSINSAAIADYPYRLIKSIHKDYKICQCKMIAPLIFWDELKNRLLY